MWRAAPRCNSTKPSAVEKDGSGARRPSLNNQHTFPGHTTHPPFALEKTDVGGVFLLFLRVLSCMPATLNRGLHLPVFKLLLIGTIPWRVFCVWHFTLKLFG